MRKNTYKEEIIKLLKNNHLLSISDLHKKITGVDYSTVYRNVEQLVADKKIRKVIFDKDKTLYEINNSQNNHDHFICNGCGSVNELERSLINLKFFKNHTVTDVLVRGLCKECN